MTRSLLHAMVLNVCMILFCWHLLCCGRRSSSLWRRLRRMRKTTVMLPLFGGLLLFVLYFTLYPADESFVHGRASETPWYTDGAFRDVFQFIGQNATMNGSHETTQLNASMYMYHRQQILKDACSTQPEVTSSPLGGMPIFRLTSVVSQQRRLFYCPAGKMASTFITRFLVAALETDPVVSPFLISIEKALHVRHKHSGNNILFTSLKKTQPISEERKHLAGLTKVIFVRCPFQRLWSAYVDKLLIPNPYYWRSWGFPAINTSRIKSPWRVTQDNSSETVPNHPDFPVSDCGQSATFSQFISFVLSDLLYIDTHVRPVTWECSPCYVQYDVIGHVESLSSDILHIVNLLHLNSSKLKSVDWEEEHAKDSIKEGVNNVFQKWLPEIQKCIKLEEAGRRLWLAFQIRGIIDEKENYPFAQRIVPDYTTLLKALLKARARSVLSREQRRRQKYSAFLTAYRTVSAELKDKIRQEYKSDFKLFGFELLSFL